MKKIKILSSMVIGVIALTSTFILSYDQTTNITKIYEGIKVSDVNKDINESLSIKEDVNIKLEGSLNKKLFHSKGTFSGTLLINEEENYTLKIPFVQGNTTLFGGMRDIKDVFNPVYITKDFNSIWIMDKQFSIVAPAKSLEDYNEITELIDNSLNKD